MLNAGIDALLVRDRTIRIRVELMALLHLAQYRDPCLVHPLKVRVERILPLECTHLDPMVVQHLTHKPKVGQVVPIQVHVRLLFAVNDCQMIQQLPTLLPLLTGVCAPHGPLRLKLQPLLTPDRLILRLRVCSHPPRPLLQTIVLLIPACPHHSIKQSLLSSIQPPLVHTIQHQLPTLQRLSHTHCLSLGLGLYMLLPSLSLGQCLFLTQGHLGIQCIRLTMFMAILMCLGHLVKTLQLCTLPLHTFTRPLDRYTLPNE